MGNFAFTVASKLKTNPVGTGVLGDPSIYNFAIRYGNGSPRTSTPTGLVLNLDVTVTVRFGVKQ